MTDELPTPTAQKPSRDERLAAFYAALADLPGCEIADLLRRFWLEPSDLVDSEDG
jgi:hypothetical protein